MKWEAGVSSLFHRPRASRRCPRNGKREQGTATRHCATAWEGADPGIFPLVSPETCLRHADRHCGGRCLGTLVALTPVSGCTSSFCRCFVRSACARVCAKENQVPPLLPSTRAGALLACSCQRGDALCPLGDARCQRGKPPYRTCGSRSASSSKRSLARRQA